MPVVGGVKHSVHLFFQEVMTHISEIGFPLLLAAHLNTSSVSVCVCVHPKAALAHNEDNSRHSLSSDTPCYRKQEAIEGVRDRK